MAGWKEFVRELYFSKEPGPRRFRYVLLAFEAVVVVFFIYSTMIRDAPWIYTVDAVLAVIFIFEFFVRLWISYEPRKLLTQFYTVIDVIVIITLLLPHILESYLFLRVLRALRLLRSYRVLADLREEFAFFRRNEEVIQSTLNLMIFVFVMTALVYVLQVQTNPNITNYIDALYFTVTALTTTGFGDITLQGTTGRLLSVVILLLGVALFLRLVQTIFRPSRVIYECPDCGLTRHDSDAVHCKHCGRVLHITTPGDV